MKDFVAIVARDGDNNRSWFFDSAAFWRPSHQTRAADAHAAWPFGQLIINGRAVGLAGNLIGELLSFVSNQRRQGVDKKIVLSGFF